jgi:hypothetical protein
MPEGTYFVRADSPSSYYLGLWLSYPNVHAAPRGLDSGLIGAGQYNTIAERLTAGLCPPMTTGLGAAHAGCFSMAFALMLSQAGTPPKRIQTDAEVGLEKVGDGFRITAVNLTTVADVPRIKEKNFQAFAISLSRQPG